MSHSPMLIDDFVGDALAENENLKPRQEKLLKDTLNYIARHGYGNLPLRILFKAAQCMLIYGMKYNDIVDLYTKYAGDWGGTSTVYRFEAVVGGKVVKSVTKAPMNAGYLDATAYRTTLTDGISYDVGAVRITARDENGNTLVYSVEPVALSVEGPIEIVGPGLVSLRGGMAGTYVRTTGEEGSATLTLSSPSLGEVKLEFEIKK